MAKYRPRRQFKFLLYQDIDMEVVLTDFVTRLKKERKFVTVIKSALRLYGSLQERDLSVLYELFPWIGEAIKADQLKPPPSPPDSGELQQQISAAVAVGVREAMMNMPSLPATIPVAKSASAPPKVETKTAPKMSADAIADNFLFSIMQ